MKMANEDAPSGIGCTDKKGNIGCSSKKVRLLNSYLIADKLIV